jgi:hypothetical protein
VTLRIIDIWSTSGTLTRPVDQDVKSPTDGIDSSKAAKARGQAGGVQDNEADTSNRNTRNEAGAGRRAVAGRGKGHDEERREVFSGINVRQAWGDKEEKSVTPPVAEKEHGVAKKEEKLERDSVEVEKKPQNLRGLGDSQEHQKREESDRRQPPANDHEQGSGGSGNGLAEHARQARQGEHSGDSPEAGRGPVQVRRPKKRGVNRWVLSKREQLLNGPASPVKATDCTAGAGGGGYIREAGVHGAGAGAGQDYSLHTSHTRASAAPSVARGCDAVAGARTVDSKRAADNVKESGSRPMGKGPGEGGVAADALTRGTYIKKNRRGAQEAENATETQNLPVGEHCVVLIGSPAPPAGAKAGGLGDLRDSRSSRTTSNVSDGHVHPRVAKTLTQESESDKGGALDGVDMRAAVKRESAAGGVVVRPGRRRGDGNGVCCFWGVERLDLPVEMRSFLFICSLSHHIITCSLSHHIIPVPVFFTCSLSHHIISLSSHRLRTCSCRFSVSVAMSPVWSSTIITRSKKYVRTPLEIEVEILFSEPETQVQGKHGVNDQRKSICWPHHRGKHFSPHVQGQKKVDCKSCVAPGALIEDHLAIIEDHLASSF